MKRYLIFAGNRDGFDFVVGLGGWNDFLGDFDDIATARKKSLDGGVIGGITFQYDWWHIVDRDSCQVVEASQDDNSRLNH